MSTADNEKTRGLLNFIELEVPLEDREDSKTARLFQFSLSSLVEGDVTDSKRAQLIARVLMDLIENDINTRLSAAGIYPALFAQSVTDFNTDDIAPSGSIVLLSGESESSDENWRTALAYTRTIIEGASCFTYEHMFRSFGERSGAVNLGSHWKAVLGAEANIDPISGSDSLPREVELSAVRLAKHLLGLGDRLFKRGGKLSGPASHARFALSRLVECRTVTKADLISAFSYVYDRHAEKALPGADPKRLEALLLFFAEEWPLRATQDLLKLFVYHVRSNDIETDLGRLANEGQVQKDQEIARREMMETFAEMARKSG